MRDDRARCWYIEDRVAVSVTRPSERGVPRLDAHDRFDFWVSSPRSRDARQLLFLQPALPLFPASRAGRSMTASGEADEPRPSKYPEEF
jgi:hypothetical protein